MHRRVVAVAVLAVVAAALVAAALVAGAFTGPASPTATGDPPADRVVRPVDGGAALWPYTSRERSVTGRTLPINVVVVGEPDRVQSVFERGTDADWTGAEGDAAVAEPPWRHASGAVRYTYVTDDPNGTGTWSASGYQLGVGSYFTTRTHVRAYPSPSANWTALQAHTEYWDWFRLRHTVTSTAAGARAVEHDLRDRPAVTDLRREYHGLGGSANSGWISVIDLGPADAAPGTLAGATALAASMALLGATATWRRPEWTADLLLPVALVGIVLGVRAAGVVAEATFSGTNPLVLAGLCYPVLALGPPLATARLGPGEDPLRAVALAAGGLGFAVVADLSMVGVAAVPVRLALHRVALVGALAVVAVGVVGSGRRVTALGVIAWGITLAAPLAGVV